MKELLHIGTIEFVSLPDDQIQNVPAKIDTGADNSSIWASNVRLQGDKLIFSFFAPGSVFYTGQEVKTTAFRTATVRNSFGDKEFRYKIKLRIKIGDHTLRRWFSLADRSNNTYPILLGKNMLKNKFIVNVAHKYLVSGEKATNKVVVLGAHSKATRDFFADVKKHNAEPVEYSCIGYDSLVYYIANQQDTRVINTADKDTDLASYTAAYFKTHTKAAEKAAAAAEYLRFRGCPFIDSEVGNSASASKLSEYMKLACFGLPIPASICASTTELLNRYDEIALVFGTPFVLKEISSDRGRNNYLVSKQSDFTKLLKASPADYTFIAQQYIPNDGFYRLYVLGKEVALAVHRSPKPAKDPLKAHLNKPAGGDNASLVAVKELPSEVKDIAARAAHCLGREVVGIDILQDKTAGTWYVLEANNAPQLRSGSFVPEKVKMVARFFDKEVL